MYVQEFYVLLLKERLTDKEKLQPSPGPRPGQGTVSMVFFFFMLLSLLGDHSTATRDETTEQLPRLDATTTQSGATEDEHEKATSSTVTNPDGTFSPVENNEEAPADHTDIPHSDEEVDHGFLEVEHQKNELQQSGGVFGSRSTTTTNTTTGETEAVQQDTTNKEVEQRGGPEHLLTTSGATQCPKSISLQSLDKARESLVKLFHQRMENVKNMYEKSAQEEEEDGEAEHGNSGPQDEKEIRRALQFCDCDLDQDGQLTVQGGGGGRASDLWSSTFDHTSARRATSTSSAAATLSSGIMNNEEDSSIKEEEVVGQAQPQPQDVDHEESELMVMSLGGAGGGGEDHGLHHKSQAAASRPGAAGGAEDTSTNTSSTTEVDHVGKNDGGQHITSTADHLHDNDHDSEYNKAHFATVSFRQFITAPEEDEEDEDLDDSTTKDSAEIKQQKTDAALREDPNMVPSTPTSNPSPISTKNALYSTFAAKSLSEFDRVMIKKLADYIESGKISCLKTEEDALHAVHFLTYFHDFAADGVEGPRQDHVGSTSQNHSWRAKIREKLAAWKEYWFGGSRSTRDLSSTTSSSPAAERAGNEGRDAKNEKEKPAVEMEIQEYVDHMRQEQSDEHDGPERMRKRHGAVVADSTLQLRGSEVHPTPAGAGEREERASKSEHSFVQTGTTRVEEGTSTSTSKELHLQQVVQTTQRTTTSTQEHRKMNKMMQELQRLSLHRLALEIDSAAAVVVFAAIVATGTSVIFRKYIKNAFTKIPGCIRRTVSRRLWSWWNPYLCKANTVDPHTSAPVGCDALVHRRNKRYRNLGQRIEYVEHWRENKRSERREMWGKCEKIRVNMHEVRRSLKLELAKKNYQRIEKPGWFTQWWYNNRFRREKIDWRMMYDPCKKLGGEKVVMKNLLAQDSEESVIRPCCILVRSSDWEPVYDRDKAKPRKKRLIEYANCKRIGVVEIA
ncbi:unnamed protein product [Amoebophrya sp. A120]|nr:unnamed protein product [Amoebophrya sp. A120]|eukprot:GSA120T00025613001.1